MLVDVEKHIRVAPNYASVIWRAAEPRSGKLVTKRFADKQPVGEGSKGKVTPLSYLHRASVAGANGHTAAVESLGIWVPATVSR